MQRTTKTKMNKIKFLAIFLLITLGANAQKATYRMLVGTYTNGTSKGIYSLEINKKGKITSQKLIAKTDNPSYIAFSPDEKYLYAVNESDENGATAFKFDKINGSLTELNKIDLADAGPCYVTVTGKHIFTSNYGNGTISVMKRETDGTLSAPLQTIVDKGIYYSEHKYGPTHFHQTLFSPDSSFVIANNLGKDCVYTYRYNPNSDTQILEQTDMKIVKKMSGPRHAVFSLNGKYLYLLEELSGGLTVFSVNDKGKLEAIQETTVVHSDTTQNAGAEILLSPDGKYIYATNRGTANDITVFRTGKDGKLTEKEHYPTNGISPRNFIISPDGKYIFVGNQKTDNITVFKRNKCTGKLKMLYDNYSIGAPVTFLFY